MGRGEREAVSDGSAKDAQNKASEVFHDVTSSVTGFFRRGKAKVEEQVNNIDTDQIKEQAGKVGQIVKGRAQQEIDGVRSDVDQARQGNTSPLINRGIDAGMKYGTFGVGGGIAGEVAKRFGIGGKIGGFVEKQLEERTRVDAAGFAKNLNEIFDRVDVNKDGFMDRGEIEASKKDKVFWAQYAFTLKYLGDKYESLQQLSNDEWFTENNGVSRGDVKALAGAAEHGTGFGAAFGNAAGHAWETTWHAGVVGAGAGIGHAFLKGGGSSAKVGLVVGGIALAGGFIHDTADYLLFRRGKLETTIKDLG